MPKKKQFNKTNAVLGYLLRYGSITRHTALSHFGIWNLPLEILKLKKRGHNIETKGKDPNLKYCLDNISEKYKGEVDLSPQLIKYTSILK